MAMKKSLKSKKFNIQKYMDAAAIFSFPAIMLVWAVSSYQ